MKMKHSPLITLTTTLITFALIMSTCLAIRNGDIVYSDEVIIDNMKLYVGGREFFVKGMAYNPAPLGIKNITLGGFGGTGYCSAKKTVWDEYKSACFGSDYFDGVSAEADRDPPGPIGADGKPEPFWQKIWERDLQIIKKMGANTIRIYNMNLLTKTFFEMYPNEYQGVKDKSLAAEHTTFFDMCEKYGLKVIAPIVTDQTFITVTDEERVFKHIEAEITELGSHPALLMWAVGNEMPLYADHNLLALVNKYMNRVRTRQQAIWNRRIPVTHAVQDFPQQYEYLAEHLDVDLFTTNAGYRDINMEPLWTGDAGFIGWTALSKKFNKALLIGEMGMHQNGDEITQQRPDWFNHQWKTVVNRTADGCIGTVFFEFSDEVNKGSAVNRMDAHMGALIPVIATKNGRSSIDKDAFIPDELVEKQYVFESIVSGLPNSPFKEYNMNADVFKLLGREPSTIQVVPRGGSSALESTIDETPLPRTSSSSTLFTVRSLFIILLIASFLAL